MFRIRAWTSTALCLGYLSHSFAGESNTFSSMARRIHCHLLIEDVDSAVEEAKQFVQKYPDSPELGLVYLEALCQKGEEVEAFEQFTSLWRKKQDAIDQKLVAEWLAWGVISKGKDSVLPMVRFYSLLGAAFTQDARAIPVFFKELRSSNAWLRSLAARLVAHYGDASLQQELLTMLKTENVWFVRMEVMQALGALQVKQAKPLLCEIAGNDKISAEERATAMVSLVNMYDSIEPVELEKLIYSDRAGLRHLASELIAHFSAVEQAHLLLPLLQDDSPQVRISAMSTLGLLQVKSLGEKPLFSYIQHNLQSPIPEVSITAGWLAMMLQEAPGREVLLKWMGQERVEYKRLSAAAIIATGPIGKALAIKWMEIEKDPYTKANLAMGLIRQREEVSLAADTLFQVFSQNVGGFWSWQSTICPMFRHLGPGKEEFLEEASSYPKVADQLVKLEMLSYLSIVGHSRALEAVKSFLQSREWGVMEAAAVTLLEEEEDACILIQKLLKDPEENVRLQAALILAALRPSAESTKVLMDCYTKVDREKKIHILEALGHIQDPSIVPFLVNILQEPYQGLRIVAAAALLHHINQ